MTTTIKSFCFFMMLCLFVPTASAVIAPSTTETTSSMQKGVTQQQQSKKEKTGFFQKQLLKKSFKRSERKGTTEGVTVVLLGLATLVSFGIASSQTGLLGLLTALLFYGVGIVFGVLFLIFLIRWAIKQS